MKIAVNVAVRNEEEHLAQLLESLLRQTRMPDEIIVVDDGSTDKTADVLKKYAAKNPIIKCIFQKNAGVSAARNRAWKISNADICFFTDGDCVPRPNWIEESMRCFNSENIGAVAGIYETKNSEHILARFVGYEIAWKYRGIRGQVDFHGAYNLAVRKKVLEEIGGFNESFITAEDADLTYRISSKYIIYFTPDSIVGHYHPEKFWQYMKNQIKRGEDRVYLYINHPHKISKDVYTGRIIKYQVLAGGLFLPSTIFIYPFFRGSYLIPLIIFLFILFCSSFSFTYIAKKDLLCALYGLLVQFTRTLAWFLGLVRGLIKYS